MTISKLLRRPAVGYALVLLAGFCVFGLYAVKLGCDLSWDLRNYHYYNPYAFLNGRIGFDYAPAQLQTYLNPVSFIPFYLAVTFLEPIQTGFLFGGLHGISFGLLFMIAHSLFASAGGLPRLGIALACAIIGTCGPIFRWQLGTSYNDNLIAPLALMALLFFVRGVLAHGAPDGRSGKAALVSAGLIMGIAAGLKLVFLIWIAAFAIAVFVVGLGWAGRFMSTGIFIAGSVAGLLVSRGHWMALLWSKFESPLFPFYNTIFRSPLYFDYDCRDLRSLPKTAEEAWRLVIDMPDGRIVVALGVILASFLLLGGSAIWARVTSQASASASSEAARRESRAVTFLAIFFVVGLAIWEVQFSIPRYLVPLELLAPIVIIGLLKTIVSPRLPAVLSILAMGVAIVMIMRPIHVPRTEWFTTYFNVDAPQFENPEEVLVVLADDEPMSYVIPFFQPEVRFVSLWGNFLQRNVDGKPPELVQEALALVRSHEGPLFAMARFNLRHVARYGIAPLTEDGQRLREPQESSESGDLYPPPPELLLWPVEALPPGTPVMKHRRQS